MLTMRFHAALSGEPEETPLVVSCTSLKAARVALTSLEAAVSLRTPTAKNGELAAAWRKGRIVL